MQGSLRKLCSLRLVVASPAVLFCVAVVGANGQSRSATDGGPQPDPVAHPTYDGSIDAPLPPGVMERATQAYIEERRLKVTMDAQRLLTLTKELEVEMKKSDQSMPSADLMKRINRIQRLAHRVESRVKSE